jgi:Haem-dependent oxidative N-demethylase, alpha subunit-like
MRPPPYLPYLAGPPSLAPGLKPIEPGKWLLPDSEAKAWLPEKTVLMRTHRAQVFADTGIPDAIAEAAEAVLAVAGPGTPDWESPLEQAAARVSDDLCILLPDDAGHWTLRAASLVAPTFWSLADKIGQPLAGLHTTVPAANPGLVSRISRMFDGLAPGTVLERFNWTVQAGPARFTPSSEPLKAMARAAPVEAALELLHFRVERQTITKLPRTGAVVFTIRTCMDPLAAALPDADHVRAFDAAWTGIDPALGDYKGWPSYERLVRAALAQLA